MARVSVELALRNRRSHPGRELGPWRFAQRCEQRRLQRRPEPGADARFGMGRSHPPGQWRLEPRAVDKALRPLLPRPAPCRLCGQAPPPKLRSRPWGSKPIPGAPVNTVAHARHGAGLEVCPDDQAVSTGLEVPRSLPAPSARAAGPLERQWAGRGHSVRPRAEAWCSAQAPRLRCA